MEFKRKLRLPGVEPGSIAWKAIILTVGLQTLVDECIQFVLYILQKLVYNGEGRVSEEFVATEYYEDLNCVDKQHHTVFFFPIVSLLLIKIVANVVC